MQKTGFFIKIIYKFRFFSGTGLCDLIANLYYTMCISQDSFDISQTKVDKKTKGSEFVCKTKDPVRTVTHSIVVVKRKDF
jgi:hypothetical protein